jgi:putative tryptophan/tyrosine transport system substrate-binding protein
MRLLWPEKIALLVGALIMGLALRGAPFPSRPRSQVRSLSPPGGDLKASSWCRTRIPNPRISSSITFAELRRGLASPPGNVTGTSLISPDLAGKRLQLLKELLPEISRVAVLWNAANPYSALVFKQTVSAAGSFGVELQSLKIQKPADIDSALKAATGQHADALIIVEDPLTIDLRKKIAEFASDHRLPAISGLRVFATSGFIMTYGADFGDIIRRSVIYVDKIFKGAKPSDLPVEQPTKFELVINLKTAKSLGLTVPSLLLTRADVVIE